MTTPELPAFLLARIAEDEATARAATPPPWTVEKFDDERGACWGINGPLLDGENYPEEVVGVDFDRRYNYPMGGCSTADTAAHIARWDPARVLAEATTERAIVAEHASVTPPNSEKTYCRICVAPNGWGTWGSFRGSPPGVHYPCLTLRLLAIPYAEHPDYRKEWAQ
jgi:hypothetical protein